MEAATSTPQVRDLAGDKAQRIIEAMRRSVARRGSAGSTFDHVAREAGVSRGLLHYYFGTKEQLLVEVVRRDGDLRLAVLDERLAEARSADDFIGVLVSSLEEIFREDADSVAVVFELFSLARRNEEIAAEMVELLRRTREHVAELLAAKHAEGVLHLGADAEAVADVLFSLADGVALRMLAEPERDFSSTVAAGVSAVRAILDDAH
jgi:AcrR family transcriptional regulator